MELIELIVVLDKESATKLDFPWMCRISVVNSEMYERWRCCRPDHASVDLDIQNVKGLWSVKAVNCLPSRKNRKCLMPRLVGQHSYPITELFPLATQMGCEERSHPSNTDSSQHNIITSTPNTNEWSLFIVSLQTT